MAERRSILSEENLPTIVAVSFVLALLATTFGVYDLLQIRGLSHLVRRVNDVNTEAISTQLSAATLRLAEIERRLGELEQRSIGLPVAAEAGTPGAAEGGNGKTKTP